MTLLGIAAIGFLILAIINRPRRQRPTDYSRYLYAPSLAAKHLDGRTRYKDDLPEGDPGRAFLPRRPQLGYGADQSFAAMQKKIDAEMRRQGMHRPTPAPEPKSRQRRLGYS